MVLSFRGPAAATSADTMTCTLEVKSSALQDMFGAGAVRAIEMAGVSSTGRVQAALGGGITGRETQTTDDGATGIAPSLQLPTALESPLSTPLLPHFADPAFRPLSIDVLTKIANYGHEVKHNRQAVVPEDHTRWFYWWVASHPAMPMTQTSVDACMQDARRDGVFPENMTVLRNGTTVQNFVYNKLKHIKHMLRRKVQANLT